MFCMRNNSRELQSVAVFISLMQCDVTHLHNRLCVHGNLCDSSLLYSIIRQAGYSCESNIL